MKRTFYLFCALVLLAGCNKKQVSNNPVINPIMPIHYTGDSMTIHRTDYLPWMEDSVMDISGENVLRTMTIGQYDLVILPNLPRVQGLYTLPYKNNNQIAFTTQDKRQDLRIIALLGDQCLAADS
ncbi:MAG: lipoprotein, partial [Paludibacteraceae bacterium]|nr:lipoprotein [Paludibacteraceae bacterium]